MRRRLLVWVALTVSAILLSFGPTEANHCTLRGGGVADFLTNCAANGQRGQAPTQAGESVLGLGFDPINLMNNEFNNRLFSTVIAGTVTNNPFGRVVDFDGCNGVLSGGTCTPGTNTLTPDRGDQLFNSCLQGMIYPFEGKVGSNGCGAAALPGMGNTARPFIRDHEVVVGTLVRTVPDPFTQSPTLVGECTGPGGAYSAANNDDNPCVNPNDPKDITEHAIFNFFVWNNSALPVKSELGGIFKISGCPPATTAGQSRVCAEHSVQQGSRAAVGPEANNGNLELPINGNGSILNNAIRFQSDGAPLEVDKSPTGTEIEYRTQVIQGIWEIDIRGTFFHNIPDGTGCTGSEAPNTIQCNMPNSTYASGKSQSDFQTIKPSDLLTVSPVLNSASQP